MTPQAGWVTNCSGNCNDESHLVSPDTRTVAIFEGIQPDSPNATSELASWQQMACSGEGALLSGIRTGTVTTTSLPANKAHLTSLAYESFAGVISTNQGTSQVYGALAVWIGPPGHVAARECYYARSSSEIHYQMTTIQAMEWSILTS